VDVVDDLLAHVNRRAIEVEGLLDRLDGALDPGAIAAGRGKKDTLDHELRIAVRRRAPDPRMDLPESRSIDCFAPE